MLIDSESYQEATHLYGSDTLHPKLEKRLRIPGVTNCLGFPHNFYSNVSTASSNTTVHNRF